MRQCLQLLLSVVCCVCLPAAAESIDSLCATPCDSLVQRELESYGVRFSHSNDVRLLESGQEKFDCLFEDIRRARHSVHLEYFNFRNDSIASQLFDLLAQKAAEGVEVRALYDAFGNSSNNQPLKNRHMRDLRSRGIQIIEYDPIRFPWINHVFSRDHRKIVVIDGRIAYTGGMNVADYYINGTPTVGSWHDMHCRLTGLEVNTLQHIFLRIWNRAAHESVYGEQYFQGSMPLPSDTVLKSNLPTQDHMTVGIVNREPRTTPKAIRQLYLAAINSARDSIKIVNPYFTLYPSLTRALERAVQRGVKVEIMLSAKSDVPLTPDCGFYNAHRLMKKGCTVWIFRPGFHHTKVIMVDGRVCTVGSANLDSRSHRWDYEENAVILNADVTRQLCDVFNRDIQDSFLLTPQTWNTFRTPWQKFRGWFAHFLAPFL